MFTITNNNKARAMGDGFICSLYGRKFIVICSGGEARLHKAMVEKGYSQAEIRSATNIQVDCMQSMGAHTFIIEEA